MESSSPSPRDGSATPTRRTHYRAFGHVLSSSLDFPELREADAADPHWSFDLMGAEQVSGGGELLGREPLYADVSARLYRTSMGLRVDVDDTGSYDILDEGRRIRWLPNPEPWWDFGRGHFLGRVLATSLHFSGLLVLHGSAVQTPEGVVAFLGGKGTGKSTLALALIEAGAKLVTDDTLAIDVSSGCLVWPGIHSLRLVPGSRPALEAGRAPGRDGKVTTDPLDAGQVMEHPMPLRSVYLLQPGISSDPERVALRVPLDPLRSTAALAGFAKIKRMLGDGEVTTLLDRAARVVDEAPVRSLLVHRSADDLPAVARRVAEWHGLPGRSPIA